MKKRNADGMGQLRSETPSYDPATKRFRQDYHFSTKTGRLDGSAVSQVSMVAMKQFRQVVEMNGYSDMAWPPDVVDVTPYDNFDGFMVRFETRADTGGKIIILQ